jgi:hypothetical protein
VATIGYRLRESFRLPAHQDPEPDPGRLVGLCSWAAALGLLGLPVAGRAWVAFHTEAVPGWFEPLVVTMGVVGITLTAAAFLAIHRRHLPWLLLTAATATLITTAAIAL